MEDKKPRKASAAAKAAPGRKRRSGAGGTLARSETVTVRLDEKLRFLADIAARTQRRTLSSFIEWSIEQALRREQIVTLSDEPARPIMDLQDSVWDIDEADRFVKLAMGFPSLLNYDEQKLWKLLKECPGLWTGRGISETPFRWNGDVHKPRLSDVRAHWDLLQKVAAGDKPLSALPQNVTVVRPITGTASAQE